MKHTSVRPLPIGQTVPEVAGLANQKKIRETQKTEWVLKNLEFLSEALKSMEGDEVSAWVVGPLSPVKLIEPQYEALVLPVKVKGEA